MSTLLGVLATIVTLAGLLGGGWAAWLARAAARLTWARAFLERATEETRLVVLEVEQTYVDRILAARAPSSPGGAELTPTEQVEALGRAVDRAMELLGLAALERACRILGLPPVPIRSRVTTWVEAHVQQLTLAERRA